MLACSRSSIATNSICIVELLPGLTRVELGVHAAALACGLTAPQFSSTRIG